MNTLPWVNVFKCTRDDNNLFNNNNKFIEKTESFGEIKKTHKKLTILKRKRWIQPDLITESSLHGRANLLLLMFSAVE